MNRHYLPLLILILLGGCLFRQPDRNITSDEPIIRPGTYSRTMIVDDLERTYLLHVPDCDKHYESYPLVLMFHGGGGTAKGVEWDTGWSNLADEFCFLVVFPDGLPEDLTKSSSFLENPQLWNDGSGRFNLEVDDVAFIDSLIEQLQMEFMVNSRQIYAAGFSNGASMAFQVGIELNESFAAIAPVSGTLWLDDFLLDTPVSLLYLTGTDDPLNPMEGGVPELKPGKVEPGGRIKKPPVEQHIQAWTQALNCRQAPEILGEFDIVKSVIYLDCDAGSEVVYYTLDGIGHHWPGGKLWLPESVVGKKTDVIQATEIIWDFFSTHPKNK